MKFKFTNEKGGKTLVSLLSEQIDGLSLSVIKKQLKMKEIKVSGKRVNKDIVLERGDTVEIFLPKDTLIKQEPRVVYDDENIAVVYKPCGMDTENNLVRSLADRYGFSLLPVHRLDRNTEGLVILAKDTETEKLLIAAIKNRLIDKFYRALLYGNFAEKQFTAEAYLKKDSANSMVFISKAWIKGSEKIATEFRLIENFDGFCDVEIRLITGKTHQIRAHSAFLGHFVLGDGKYGDNKINRTFGYSYQQLKAVKLIFGKLEGKLQYLSGKEISV